MWPKKWTLIIIWIVVLVAGVELYRVSKNLLRGDICQVVYEFDLPKWVRNLAQNQDAQFEEIMAAIGKDAISPSADFFELLQAKFAAAGIPLNRYFGSPEQADAVIVQSLKDACADAIAGNVVLTDRRIQRFGVSVVSFTKKRHDRIIVGLAGDTNIDSIKSIIEKPALLEFRLLEEAKICIDVLVKIDKLLARNLAAPKGEQPAVSETAATDTSNPGSRVAQDKAISVSELFDDSPSPLLSLLRSLPPYGTDVAVAPLENYHAVDSILNSASVQMLIPQDAEFTWSNTPEKYADADYYCLYLLKKRSELTGFFLAEAYATQVASEVAVVPSPPIEAAQETLKVVDEYLFHADLRLAELTGYHLINPRPSLDGQKRLSRQGKWVVNIKLRDEGAPILSSITQANLHKHLAIVLDKRVLIALRVKEMISHGVAQIEGNMNASEAKDLSSVLHAASLPAPMKIVEVRPGRSSKK